MKPKLRNEIVEDGLKEEHLTEMVDRMLNILKSELFGVINVDMERSVHGRMIRCVVYVRGPRGLNGCFNIDKDDFQSICDYFVNDPQCATKLIQTELIDAVALNVARKIEYMYARRVVREYFKGENVWKFGKLEREWNEVRNFIERMKLR